MVKTLISPISNIKVKGVVEGKSSPTRILPWTEKKNKVYAQKGDMKPAM